MASNTSNLNLVKQANNENWSNDIHNANLQKIDDFAGTTKAQVLANGSNLNDVSVPSTGAHVLYSGNNISQMVNAPSEVASQAWPFLLECFKVGPYTRQILHVYAITSSPVNIYVRSQSYVAGGTTWLGWEKLARESPMVRFWEGSVTTDSNGRFNANSLINVAGASKPVILGITCYEAWYHFRLYHGSNYNTMVQVTDYDVNTQKPNVTLNVRIAYAY